MLLRVRRCEHNPTEQEIYQVLAHNNEVLDAAYQDAWDIEMNEQKDAGLSKTAFQVYLQQLPSDRCEYSKEILAVEFPDTHCSYSFQSVRGVAQWYFIPLPGFSPARDLPAGLTREVHVFFETVLVPITTSTFNGLGAFLRLRDDQPVCLVGGPEHKHYILKVLVHALGVSPQEPFHTVGTHTMHFVCGTVGFACFVIVLCGIRVGDYSLMLVGEEDRCYYYGYESSLMKVSDVEWPGVGKAVVLRPFPDMSSRLY